MNETERDVEPASTGSWTRVYVLVCAAAIVYIALLAWFTATFNQPGAS